MADKRLFLLIEKTKNTIDMQLRSPFWSKIISYFNVETQDWSLSELKQIINLAARVSAQNRNIQLAAIDAAGLTDDSSNEDDITPNKKAKLTAKQKLLLQQQSTNQNASKKRLKIIDNRESLKINKPYAVNSILTTIQMFHQHQQNPLNYTVSDLIESFVFMHAMPETQNLYKLFEQLLHVSRKQCETSCDKITLYESALNDLQILSVNTNFNRFNMEMLKVVYVKLGEVLKQTVPRLPMFYQIKNDRISFYFDDENTRKSLQTHVIDVSRKMASKLINEYTPVVLPNASKLWFTENLEFDETINVDRMIFRAVNNIFNEMLEKSISENIDFENLESSLYFLSNTRYKKSKKSTHKHLNVLKSI